MRIPRNFLPQPSWRTAIIALLIATTLVPLIFGSGFFFPYVVPRNLYFRALVEIGIAMLVLALSSGDGRDAAATTIYAVIGGTDYLDGITARVTGQYSRLGTLLDPLVDRLLVISGVIVCYRFDLLPRWALIVLAARELVMLVLTRIGMRRGMDLKVNMVGRWAVWPTMFSLFLAMVSTTWVAPALLYVGLAMTLWATALYFRDGWNAMHQNTQA